MSKSRVSGWALVLLVLAAILLTLAPVPEVLRALRPFWMALVVVYACLEWPDEFGLGTAFLLGLISDLMSGVVFGEHAFRLVVVAFIMLRFRSRIRFFPMWQQTAAVFALLLNDRIVTWMLRTFTGEFAIDWRYWLAPFVGALLWPWFFLLVSDLTQRRRSKAS
ncbi:MAG: rod shape-determining protein MreD [Ahniella sp.]|nr:rod shape-determining protein MreD [Ahniella sp.]